MSAQLLDRPAREIAEAVRTRRVSARELVATSLERLRENSDLNAFCYVLQDTARAAAAAIDRGEGDPARPLLGVPFAAKDMTPTAGVPATLGSWSSGDAPATTTAIVVQRLQAAGAILVGKTTTPEFAHSSFCATKRWGITRNPHDLSRTPGGSSGGSGAAVAAGVVPFAEGTDMGGSVRIPAAFCGVVGLKPSFGRIPMDILPSAFDSISHFGPLARTVDDAIAFMAAVAGPDDADPFSLPIPFDEAAARAPVALAGRRFALSVDLGFYAVDDEVRATIAAAALRLRAAGATVNEVALPWTREVVDRWTDLWGAFMSAFFGDRPAQFADRMDPIVLALIARGEALGATAYKQVELLRTAMWRELRPILAAHDALLCPTCAVLPPPVEMTDDDFFATTPDGKFAGLDMTCPFNMVPFLPAISLPAGTGASGLPVGLQVVGRRNADEALLALSAAMEPVLAGG